MTFTPSKLGARSATITVASTGVGSPQSIDVSGMGTSTPPPAAFNYQGLWWGSPAGSESGWGINFAHQRDTIFATWFTYDHSGHGWWLAMTAARTGGTTYSGTLYSTSGPPFGSEPFDPAAVAKTAVGTGTLTFSDADHGVFSYTLGGTTQSKAITREVFAAAAPVCAFGGQPNLALATNFTDLWWIHPAGSESGWGVNFTHQGTTIFATWFTYDLNGDSMWLVVTAEQTGPGTYTGTLYWTTGPAFDAIPFDPDKVEATAVGTATIVFADGNDATFSYSVDTAKGTVARDKHLVREVFEAPGTTCH
jgi:hypothetical protein